MNFETILMWCIGGVGGLSVTGFFYLLTLISKIEGRVDTAVGMKKDFDEVVKLLNEIRDALLGTYHEKGLITRHHSLEERVFEVEKILKEIK